MLVGALVLAEAVAGEPEVAAASGTLAAVDVVGALEAEAVCGTLAAADVVGALEAAAVSSALAAVDVVGARADAAPAHEAERRCTGACGRDGTNQKQQIHVTAVSSGVE